MTRAMLLVIFAASFAGPVRAAIFAVDATADAVDAAPGNGVCATAGGSCTLRAAIQEANALAGGDTINLPAGTYTLSLAGGGEDAGATGDLDVSTSGALTIAGAGALTTVIDGAAIDRVIQIGVLFGGCPAAFMISDVTIRNGLVASSDGGAGILTHCGLTLARVIVRDNDASNGVGGGIAAAGDAVLAVSSSAIVGNSANEGGGIFQLVDSIGMTLTNVTLSGNRARGNGGGLAVGLFNATLNNVTITDNEADSDVNGSGDGGGVASTYNGAFIFAAVVFLRNSIVAGNTDAGGQAPDCVRQSPSSITSQGYNVIGDTTGCTIGGDLTGNVTGVNALLGPLADNGGGTLTHELLAGSPAGDAGNPSAPGSGGNACAATDQRGTVRPVGPRCDAGAFEGGTFAGPELDHYKCYAGKDLKNPPFTKRTEATTDQLGSETVDVRKLKFVCVPADKNGEGIQDPAAHLTCYQIKGGLLPEPVAEVTTQFQTSRLELKKPKLLCLPSTKTVLP